MSTVNIGLFYYFRKSWPRHNWKRICGPFWEPMGTLLGPPWGTPPLSFVKVDVCTCGASVTAGAGLF